MGFLKNLFNEQKSIDIQNIAINISNHVPNVVTNWYDICIASFKKQLQDNNEIVNHIMNKDLEFYVKVYYCFLTAGYINKQKLINQNTANSFSINFLQNVFKHELDRASSEMMIFYSNMNEQYITQTIFCTKVSKYIFNSDDEKYVNMLHFKNTYLIMAVHSALFMNFNDNSYKNRIINSLPIQHQDYDHLQIYLNSEIAYWERLNR